MGGLSHRLKEDVMRSTPLVGLCRSASLAGDHVRLPPGPATAKQGIALSTGPADRGGNHRRDARSRRSLRRSQAAQRDHRALACRVADQRSARPAGERSRPDTRRRVGAPRQGRQAPRGRDGPVGLGAARAVAHDPRRAAGWRALLRAPGPHLRPPLLPIRDSRPTAQRRPRGRGAPPVRAAPAPPRPRRRDESGRSPTTGHPTATRSRRPRDQWRRSPRELRA